MELPLPLVRDWGIMSELRKAVNSALSPSYLPHSECLGWKNPHWGGRNNSWKCQEGSYQNGLTDRLNSSQYYQYTEGAGAAVHTPSHRLSPHRWSLQAKGKRHSLLYILFFFFSPQQKGHHSLQGELGRWNVQVLGSSCPFSPPLFHPGQECPSLGATSRWCPQPSVAPHLPPASHWPTPCTWLGNYKKTKLFTKNKGRFSQSLLDGSGFQS